MRTQTCLRQLALLLAMSLVMAACGGGGGTPAAAATGTTLGATTAYPGQFITVLNPLIADDALIDVVFRTPAGSALPFEGSVPVIALDPGELLVAAPTVIDPATGAPLAANLEVGVLGEFSTTPLFVNAPLSLGHATEGLVLLAMLEFALDQNWRLLDQLDDLALEDGVEQDQIDAQQDAVWDTIFDLDDQIIELSNAGTFTQDLPGGPVTLGPAALTRLDETIMAYIVGGRILVDEGPPPGAATQRARGTRSEQSYRERLDEMWRALGGLEGRAATDSGIFNVVASIKGAIQGVPQSAARGARHFGYGVAAIGAYIWAFGAAGTTQASAVADAAAVPIAALGSALNGLLAWADGTNTDQLGNRSGGFDGNLEIASQLTRVLSRIASKLPIGELPADLARAVSRATFLKDTLPKVVARICELDPTGLFCAERGATGIDGDVTSLGTVSASSSFDAGTGPALAVDGLVSTNWFSDGTGGGGPNPNTEIFTWAYAGSGNILLDQITSDPETFQDADPKTDDAYGFERVVVQIFNSAGAVVHTEPTIYPVGKRIALFISLPAGIRGNKIVISLVNHENAVCGGFSELRIWGRTP